MSDPTQVARCEGKATFASISEARRVIKRQQRRASSAREAYRCDFCGSVHIGRKFVKKDSKR